MCVSLVAAFLSTGDGDDDVVETSQAENFINAEHISINLGEDDHYYANMRTLYNYLDTIENITRPGCSSDFLDMALESMSQIVANLSLVSSSS